MGCLSVEHCQQLLVCHLLTRMPAYIEPTPSTAIGGRLGEGDA